MCYSHRNFAPLQESIGISHLYEECQEESQVIRDESKDHSAVDESSSEQQIREPADYTLIVKKNWSPSPSATGSYGRQACRQAGRETKSYKRLNFLKFFREQTWRH